MESPHAHTVLCSSCFRPLHSPLYKTCPACRQKAHRQRLRRRLLATAEEPTSLSTRQSLLPSTTLPSPTQRTLCSNCAQPWQSSRYRTCDRCRQWEQNRRRLATMPERLSSTEFADGAQDGFSALQWELIDERDGEKPCLRWRVSVRALRTIRPFEELVRAAPQKAQYLLHRLLAYARRGFIKRPRPL